MIETGKNLGERLKVKVEDRKLKRYLNPTKYKSPLILLVVILVVLTALFTYGPKVNKNIPTWQKIYSFCGLNLEEGKSVCEDPLCVAFIDVGQGDCIFINGEDTSILIDTGEDGNAERILTFLQMYGIKELDYLILSHPHSDHMGSMQELTERIPVNSFVVPKIENESLMTNIEQHEFESIKASTQNVLEIKNSQMVAEKGEMKLEVISDSHPYDNLNDASMVVKLTYGKTSFLFMGDASRTAEYALQSKAYKDKTLTLHADVLKVGHHGSNSSSTKDFIAAVHPALAVIMCGKNNPYGHPHKETLETLNQNNVKVLRTDEKGTIVLGSNGIRIKDYT